MLVSTGAAAQDLQHHHLRHHDGEGGDPQSPRAEISEDLLNACLQAKDLSAVQRMNDGKLEDLPLDDIRDLFDAIGTEPNGGLTTLKVRYMLRHLIEPRPHTESQAVNRVLNKVMDSNDKRTVSAEEFHMLLSVGPNMAFISQLRELAEDHRNDHHHQLDVIPDRTDEATRDDLCEFVGDKVDKHDAFMTLPITLIYIFIFIFLVWQHLRIEDRRDLAESMKQWVNGREPLTALDNNCEDMNSYWEWLDGVGLSGLLGNPQVNDHTNYTQYVVASRNIVLGDVHMEYEQWDGTTASQWLLQTDVAQAHLNSTPSDFLGAARLAANSLRANGWDSADISLMQTSFLSYSETIQMYGLTTVKTCFEATGNTRCVIGTVTVLVNLYPYWPVVIVDIFFVMIIAMLAFQELRDICSSLRLGFDEFLDYWKYWNIVDWISITLGLLVTALWSYMCLFIGDGAQATMLDADYRLQEDVMTLDITTVEEIQSQVDKFGWVLFLMHIVTAVNTFTIVLKFFKAFSSNPRLQVVTDTLRNAAGDLCHFMIIFLTIFLPFAIVGHLLFGSDLADFASFSASANTGIISLMGEFTWYVEGVGPLQFTKTLPSGIPCLLVFMWYFVYMFMVLLVLLNMLLAIILKHYTTVTDALGEDAPAIWRQVQSFWRFQQETRGFISLEKLRRALENDDDPAHEEEMVTGESLEKAFDGMSGEQANWLTNEIQKVIQMNLRQRELDADSRRIEHVESLLAGTSEELRLVAKAVQDTKEKLMAQDMPKGRARGPTMGIEAAGNDDARLDALERDVANVLQKLTSAKENQPANPASGPAEISSSDQPPKPRSQEASTAAKSRARQRLNQAGRGVLLAQSLAAPARPDDAAQQEIIGASSLDDKPAKSQAARPRKPRPAPQGLEAPEAGALIPSDLPRSYGNSAV